MFICKCMTVYFPLDEHNYSLHSEDSGQTSFPPLTTTHIILYSSYTTITTLFLHCIGAPVLTDAVVELTIFEGADLIVDNLEESPTPFPFPVFQWTKNNELTTNNTQRVVYGYPSVSFSNISQNDSGSYALFAENFRLDSVGEQIGNDTAIFTLDVLCKSL